MLNLFWRSTTMGMEPPFAYEEGRHAVDGRVGGAGYPDGRMIEVDRGPWARLDRFDLDTHRGSRTRGWSR